MLFVVWRWFLLLAIACRSSVPVAAPQPPAAAPIHYKPRVLLYLDTSALTVSQRATVREAAMVWELQTGGCVSVREGEGVHVVQMPYVHPHPWFAVGYWTEEDALIEVKFEYRDPVLIVIHEIGHVLGMEHVDSPRSVMFRAPHVRMFSPEDYVELYRVTRCAFAPT